MRYFPFAAANVVIIFLPTNFFPFFFFGF